LRSRFRSSRWCFWASWLRAHTRCPSPPFRG
jgi:hypothetical protein